ncbi:MAG: hypothetical protein IJO01_00365 [Oscillospiraceae bacterium]|nr:hypothetical protein [Oscillospiraceae bacterium]
MVLNLINFIQAGVLWAIIIPELLFAIHLPHKNEKAKNKVMNIVEQIGRYASMLLMILPLGIWEFGFTSSEEMIIYFAATAVLIVFYIIVSFLYYKKQDFSKAVILAVIRITVFIICGILLRHWLLVVSSVIFAVGHIYSTFCQKEA